MMQKCEGLYFCISVCVIVIKWRKAIPATVLSLRLQSKLH